ncbi:hypothetical protein FF1_010651 [Malus domestica]
MTHILKICDDDTTQWSSNKRFKLMLKDRSLETVTDTLDGVKSEISKRMVLLSNRKELHSNADYKALLLSGNVELDLEGDTVFVVPKDLLKLKVKSSLTRGTDHVHQVKVVEAVGKLREMLRRIGDEMFRLPSQPYDFEYKVEVERVQQHMDELRAEKQELQPGILIWNWLRLQQMLLLQTTENPDPVTASDEL